jgi:hypothetical protein
MLQIFAVILLVLWGPGLVTSYTMGGFIHVFPVIAVLVVLILVIQTRRPCRDHGGHFAGEWFPDDKTIMIVNCQAF